MSWRFTGATNQVICKHCISQSLESSLMNFTAQKMKFPIKDFFSKCDQICRKLWIWSHLLKKSLVENFIFCAVFIKGQRKSLFEYYCVICITYLPPLSTQTLPFPSCLEPIVSKHSCSIIRKCLSVNVDHPTPSNRNMLM